MPIRKKSHGRVIMVSDFILESTGTLVLRDNDSNVIQRAKKIICPGSNGDNWWTAEDVVKQVSLRTYFLG